MNPDMIACAGCGTLTHIEDLDAKDGGEGDHDVLLCRACYGPGWLPMSVERYNVRHPDAPWLPTDR